MTTNEIAAKAAKECYKSALLLDPTPGHKYIEAIILRAITEAQALPTGEADKEVREVVDTALDNYAATQGCGPGLSEYLTRALTALLERREREAKERHAQQLAEAQRRENAIWDMLYECFPVLQEKAEEERSFWGAQDKHGIARESGELAERVRLLLNSTDPEPDKFYISPNSGSVISETWKRWNERRTTLAARADGDRKEPS